MKKHLVLKAVLVGLSLVGMTQAQESRSIEPASSTPVEQAIFDDDGGRVFIVGRNVGVLGSLRYHGGEVISQPEQFNIFLGSAWSGPSLQKRETVFANLLSQKGLGVDQLAVESYGVKNTFLPSGSYEQPYDFSTDHSVSDIQVR